MKKLLLILLIIKIVSVPVQGQIIDPNWKYIRSTNTGLGGSYFRNLEFDQCGNLWTGGYDPFFSEGSVVRYNNSVFTDWSNFEGYIPNAQVYGIAFDNNNGVWVACNANTNFNEHGGVAYYNGATWTKWDHTNSPLATDYMNAIAIDHNNNVWATFSDFGGSQGGVAKYDGTTWTIYTPSNSGIPSTECTDIDVDAQNNIWIGSNLGLIKFDGLNWITFTTANSGISFNGISDVEVDESTNKIYAATTISVDIYDGSNWTHINTGNSPFPNINLTEIDARGDTVIIGSLGGESGAWIYDGANWISHVSPSHVKDVRIDNAGNFWVCGNGFVEKYDGISWVTYTSMNTGLTSMFNNDVFVDSKNRAWFASGGNGGINMFDCPEWQDYGPYNEGLWNIPFTYTGIGAGTTEDSYGDIWMSYYGLAGGVAQVTGGDVNNPAAWHIWDNNNSGVSLQFLKGIAADQSGNVWVGYDGFCSVAKYSHATNAWTTYNLFSLGQISCGSGSGINSIRVDNFNNVWICGRSGLAKYDQANWTFYSYLNTPLPQGDIADVAFDMLGNVWVATENGLFKFDGVTWTLFNTSNSGMIGDYVYTLLTDDNGLLWVSCGEAVFPPYPSGICSFDGTTWTQYTTDNSGLQEKLVKRMALDTLGNVWVMSEGKGAAIFNPNGVTGYECIDKSLQSCIATTVEHPVQAMNSLSVSPNPFIFSSTITFYVEKAGQTSVSIYDATGKKVKLVFTGHLSKGNQKMEIDSRGLSQGIYFCKVLTSSSSNRIKLVIQ